jgi:hypothetical protein
MSIYPVRLSEWYPYNDEHYGTVLIIVEISRCLACRKRLRYKSMIGHHSIPWGYGDTWCSWKCCHSGKIAGPDKRNARSVKRRVRRYERKNYVGYADLNNSG